MNYVLVLDNFLFYSSLDNILRGSLFLSQPTIQKNTAVIWYLLEDSIQAIIETIADVRMSRVTLALMEYPRTRDDKM